MIELDEVATLIRAVASAEILPRFRALGAGDVREKKPGDLVTVADVAAEERLSAGLTALAPGSVAIGEESVAEDAARLGALDGDAPVWIIDPIDGTGNYAKGVPRFAVIVAYVERASVTAGWIYDPFADVMVAARKGAGAWSNGNRLAVAGDAQGRALVGSAYGRTSSGLRAREAIEATRRVGAVRNRGSSGIEYIEIARADSHFTLHSRSLPWDHAAGMLIVAEAGGVAGFLDGSAYDPRILDKKPLAAASKAAWHIVAEIVTQPAPTEG